MLTSKSTFNAAFKKYALITPTAYRLKNFNKTNLI